MLRLKRNRCSAEIERKNHAYNVSVLLSMINSNKIFHFLEKKFLAEMRSYMIQLLVYLFAHSNASLEKGRSLDENKSDLMLKNKRKYLFRLRV